MVTIMLFVVRCTQPVNCTGGLPLTSVVPSTFSSIGQHTIYNSTPRELPLSVLCASLRTSLPCPSHLHPSVRLHNTGLWKEKTELLTETYSLSLLSMSELTCLYFMTSWMFQSSLSQTPLLLCSFLLVLSATEA